MNNTHTPFQFGRLTPTAEDYIDHSDAFLNIAVGSVRSGKTITCLLRFLDHILGSPHTTFAMAGKTIGALRRNVVNPFCQMLNAFGIRYIDYRSLQEIHFGDKRIALFGIDKEGADTKIQGFTCAGALIDEATTMPQSGFQMLLSRCSLSGAHVFVTCNPTNPLNYVYTDYVNNQELLKSGRCKVWNFLLEDNTHLTREYIENLKAMYPRGSVFYKRHILNQWVSGQGAIFDSFTDDNILTGDVHLEDYLWFGIGSDYGVSTTSCYSLIGKTRDGFYDVITERYYNAEQEGRSQSDTQRVDDIYHLQEDYKLDQRTTFWCSHDAENLRVALEQDPRITMNIDTFMPNTLECIQVMSQLFHENKLRIHESCTETIKQVQGYEWDLKASQRGEDKPVKKDDHLVDSMRAPLMMEHKIKRVLAGVVHF